MGDYEANEEAYESFFKLRGVVVVIVGGHENLRMF